MIPSSIKPPTASTTTHEPQTHVPPSPRDGENTSSGSSVGLPAYTAQSVGNTTKAFVIPTLVSGVLPPPVRSMVYVPAGVTYAHLRTSPQGVSHQPQPSRSRALSATAIGLSPFLPLLSLQTHFAGSNLKAGQIIQRVWTDLVSRLPAQVAQALRNYPINQILARATAQIGAAALGSVMSHAYLTRTGQATLKRQPASVNNALPNPDTKALACLSGAVLFSVPALVASPHMATLVPGWAGLPPVAKTAVVTSLLIGAAVTTSAIAMQRVGSSDPAGSTWPDADQLPLSADLIDAAVESITTANRKASDEV